MKNVLKMLGGMVAGALIGIIVVIVLILLSGGSLTTVREIGGVAVGHLLSSLSFAFLSLFLAIALHVILHEAGHCLMGLLTGYRFVSYRVGSLALIRTDDGRYHCKHFSLAGTLGQCLMEPPARAPYFWYNAGGVLTNFLLAGLSVIVLRQCQLSLFGENFFFMMAFVGFFMGAMNAVPLRRTVNNDGMNILSMYRHPELRADFVHQLQMAAQLSYGHRLSEMPAEWFEVHEPEGYTDSITLSTHINRLGLLEDQFRFEEARQYVEQLKTTHKMMPTVIRMETDAEHLMLELATTRRQQVIEQLWTPSLKAYVKASAKSTSARQVLLFALDLYEGRHAEATQRLLTLRDNINGYAFPGEARSSVAMMEELLKTTEPQT